jgi:hypothetical protein
MVYFIKKQGKGNVRYIAPLEREEKDKFYSINISLFQSGKNKILK